MPGETGTIKVHYNTNNVGSFSKTVTVTSNAVDNPRVVLRIKGKVEAKDGEQTAKPQPRQVQPVQRGEDLKGSAMKMEGPQPLKK